MSNALVCQIEILARRLQRRRVLTATCWALVAMVVVALALVGVDRLLGIDDVVGRSLCTAALVATLVVVGRRWRAAAWDRPVTELEVAAQVERRHPQLRDMVTSALDFSRQSDHDPTGGSRSLRRAVLLHATSGVTDINWNELVPRRPLRRAAIVTTAVVALVSLLAWWTPTALGIGVLRLLNPLSSAEWPRVHDLHFVDTPTILAAGDDLVLTLRDHGGDLPSPLAVHYRLWRNDRWQEETVPLAAAGREIEIRRPSVQSSLEYRAAGGDHRNMPWQKLQVVAPPRLKSLQLTVHPPAYTGLPSRPVDDPARVLIGSEIQLHAETDQPVVGATLRGDTGWQLPLQIGEAGTTFSTVDKTWRAEQSDVVSFELTTPSGLTTRAARRIVLEAVADLPPEVRFVQPASDVTVVPTARLDLTIAARDDLALRDLQLAYRRSDRSDVGDQVLPLWRDSTTSDQVASLPDQQLVYPWHLAELDLRPGCVIEAHARASDYRPAIGQTNVPLRIVVVSVEEMVRRIIDRESTILQTIEDLLQRQRQLRAVTADWLDADAAQPSGWVNDVHASLYAERRLAAALDGDSESVVAQVSQLVAELARNRLERPAMIDRLQQLRATLEQLTGGPLPRIDELLSELIRQTPQGLADNKRLALLRQIADRQDEVIAGLEAMAARLGEGNLLGQLERELLAVLDEQGELARHGQREIAPALLQRPEAPNHRAALEAVEVASAKQRRLARRLAELLLRMAQSSLRLADSPTLAARVESAVVMSRELKITATMQSAAENLSARRMGRCAAAQQQAIDDLKKLLRRLRGRDALAAEKRLQRIQHAERELQQLRRQTAERQQQHHELAQKIEQLADKIEQLRVAPAAEAARQAAALLQSQPAGAARAKQAVDQLDQAGRDLAEERRRQQVALARLQLAQLDAQLAALVAGQQSVVDEIERLVQQLPTPGEFSDRVKQVTAEQLALRDDSIDEASRVESLPVFAHLLRTAAGTMQQVATRLEEQRLDKITQQHAEDVLEQLGWLVQAVREERKNLAAGGNPAGGGGGTPNAGDTPQAQLLQLQSLQLAIGQLRLLRQLQSALYERTRKLETEPPGEPLAERARALAAEQAQLAELAEQLQPEVPQRGQRPQPKEK